MTRRLLHLTLLILLGIWSCKEEPRPNVAFKPILPPPDKAVHTDYDNTSRDIWQQPDRILELLGPLDKATVADIGAGNGFFTLRLVKTAQKVIAIDIDPKAIQRLDSIKTSLPLSITGRLETRLSQPMNPLLKDQEVEAVLLVNTYVFLPNRIAYLQTVRKGMKPGGKLLIVDFKDKQTPIGPKPNSRVPQLLVEKEVTAAGFLIEKSEDSMLDYQYIVLCSVPK
jgi:SAM-dependent methyltransferase